MNNLTKVILYMATFMIVFFYHPLFSSAHIYLVKSFPSDNQIVKHSPKKVTIEFNDVNGIRVLDENGRYVDHDKRSILHDNPKMMKADVIFDLPNGIYNVNWKEAASAQFQIGTDKQTIGSKTKGNIDLIIISWIQYISGFVYIGLLFFQLCILPKGSLQSTSVKNTFQKVSNTSFVLLFLSILLSLPLQAGISWLNVWSPLKEILTNSFYGQVWMVEAVILVLLSLMPFLLKKPVTLKWVSFSLGICFLAAKAITSHAFYASHKYLTITMDLFHLLSAAIWIGSLIAMIIFLPIRKREEGKFFFRGLIHLFFPWGAGSVIVLSATGIYGTLLYLPTVNALFTTAYGRVLSAKIVLFLIMIVFAFFHVVKGRRGGENGWGTSYGAEMVIGAVVLVLAVILANLPTP